MKINIYNTLHELGKAAGVAAAQYIRKTIEEKASANIILATGTSQFEILNQLISAEEIDWSKVVMFHLDEYIGLPITHKASFRKYLQERLVDRAPGLQEYYFIDGEASSPKEECARLGKIIANHPIDLALVGVGENGHLAFNDPPADFKTREPYIVVALDEACRRQQVGEGWFPSLADVPARAISMSVRQILEARRILCVVPDQRKAEAVRAALEGPVTPAVPASILQTHPDVTVFLDRGSASLLARP